MKPKKYRGNFQCGVTGDITSHDFEEWLSGDGELITPIVQLVEDWAYGFYDKGSYTTLDFEEITLEDQEYELSLAIMRAAKDYDWEKTFINTTFEGYSYNIFRDWLTGDWYIQVGLIDDKKSVSSGWWSKSKDENIRAAIVEAIRYAGILE